jgi:hypothetical protein
MPTIHSLVQRLNNPKSEKNLRGPSGRFKSKTGWNSLHNTASKAKKATIVKQATWPFLLTLPVALALHGKDIKKIVASKSLNMFERAGTSVAKMSVPLIVASALGYMAAEKSEKEGGK